MNDWLLLPRPQRFTELYFTDHHKLPSTIHVGTTQEFPFTVRNLEHQNTTYHYQIIALPEDGRPEHLLSEGTFTLAHNQLQMIDQAFVLPVASGYVTAKINLNYKGIPTASNTPVMQTQSIYWRINIAPHSDYEERNGG
jgi:hypothetical protein